MIRVPRRLIRRHFARIAKLFFNPAKPGSEVAPISGTAPDFILADPDEEPSQFLVGARHGDAISNSFRFQGRVLDIPVESHFSVSRALDERRLTSGAASEKQRPRCDSACTKGWRGSRRGRRASEESEK
jgi:hypothetical protein